VSDNETALTSADVQEFFKVRGIEHVLTGTYRPFSNGQAEGAVRMVKEQFKRTSAAQGEKRLHHAVAVLRLVPGGGIKTFPSD